MAHDFKKFPELSNSQMETLYFESPHEQIVRDFQAVVTKVHDGDTITLSVDFRDFDFPLRFLGTNAPEMNEEGGTESRDWLAERILNEEVTIMIDKNNRVGKYGRLLGKVFYGGLDINEESMRAGQSTTFANRREAQLPNMDKEMNIRKWF